MKNTFTTIRSIIIFSFLVLTPLLSKSQNWQVGVPVYMPLSDVFMFSSGCYPAAADYTFSFEGSQAAGVSFYMYIDSVVDNTVFMTPGPDTLVEGDSILIPPGINNMGVYFFTNSGIMMVSFKAVGTPTTVGDAHPCGFNNTWFSNLMFCPEGIGPVQSFDCQVEAGGSFSASIDATNPTCFGLCNGSATCNTSAGIPPVTYLWSTGETTQTITNLCDSTYTVVATDAASSSFTASISLVAPTEITIDDTITNATCATCADGSAGITITGGTPPYSIVWSSGGDTTNTISDKTPGEYIYTVTDSSGCTVFDTAVIGFNNGVNEFTIAEGLFIYPNPVAEQLNIQSNTININTIQLSEVTGRIIAVKTVSKKHFALNINSLPAGLYFITVQMADGNKLVKQFVKE